MSDFESLDYYELLGVSRSASLDEIKRAYRREISKYHPDRFVNAAPEAQEYASQRSQRLTEAYSVLSDFAARSAYNRGQSPGAAGRRQRPAAPAQPRDHQAELYEQAQVHLAAGRTLQAIGALRQLQQINPFYRDSAELLALAEQQLNSRADQPPGRMRRPLLIAGGVAGGVAATALVAWAIGVRGGTTANRPPEGTTAPIALVATDLPTRPPEPTFAPAPPTQLQTVAPSPSPAPPTEPPSALPTELPTALPIQATALPATETPLLASETGELLFVDEFSSSGWADLSGPSWRVGYQRGRYRIAADPGAGAIWSYHGGPAQDISIGVDMQVTSGEGGLLVRFLDANNYLSITLNPSQTSYRLEHHSGGRVNVLAGGQSEAIRGGADVNNRLVVRVRGNHLQVLSNSQLLAELDAPGASNSTRYGLLAIASDTAAEAFFDNLEIRKLE